MNMTAETDVEDNSQINRCRCALKQIKKVVMGGVVLLQDLPDTYSQGKPHATPYTRMHCRMVSELDFGGENPLVCARG